MDSVESNFRAFNVTISVREDISDECVAAVYKWIKKNAQFYYCVCESDTSKRHLHAMLLFAEIRNKKKMRENLWDRLVKPFHPTSVGRVALNIHVCPGRKWIDEYLIKEAGVEVIGCHLPNESLGDPSILTFFPTEAEQEKLMAAKDVVIDLFYNKHEIAYKEYLKDRSFVSSSATAHEYFLHRMFVGKDMRVIADSRRVHQLSVALHRYASDCCKLTALELQTHNRENGDLDFGSK